MVRNYVRKTPARDKEKLKDAISAVLNDGLSVRNAAKRFGVGRMSLSRHCEAADSENVTITRPGLTTIFNNDQERALVSYILQASDIYFGLSPKEIRRLGFEFARQLKLDMPDSWMERKLAGEDWFSSFLKRHRNLSIRKPQATSLARASAFNRVTVKEFFKNLQNVYERVPYPPRSIYNMDETGITTVQNPARIVSRRGFKQIGKITSAERGTLVTMALAVSAQGNFIPPFFVFPRKKYKPHFLSNAPVGSAGSANKSGWMISSDFLLFLKHFQNHSQASATNPVLLILDNHQSHTSIEALQFCQQHHITVLSLPPHCSHKLQPLDRSVFGPLKKFYNNHCDYWMLNNPGKTMTIYDIPSIVTSALPLAATNSNIASGFRVSGICPLNPDVFREIDFLPSHVTDREWTGEDHLRPASSTENDVPNTSRSDIIDDDTPLDQVLQSIRAFPKAGERKVTRRGRKRRRSAILTDETEVNTLVEELTQKTKKTNKNQRKEPSTEQPVRRQRGRPRKIVRDSSNDD